MYQKNAMQCKHLKKLEAELLAAGISIFLRGKTWGDDQGEFVYFECILDRESIRRRLSLADCVQDEAYLGTHMGSEYGFYCKECRQGIMGYHPKSVKKSILFG